VRKASPNPLARNRHIALTLGTGAMAALTAIFLIGAPPIPVAAGVVLAVGWLIWRAPAE
jgi:hypothetical protein